MKMGVKRRQHADITAAIAMVVLAVFVVSCAYTNRSAATDVTRETLRVQLLAGAAEVDVYWPIAAAQAPMVIVAHGFSRHRHNMSGWGQHLAKEGIVAVVPDLPSRSDHARNGRFLSELRAYWLGDESLRKQIDPARVGLLGFSAGGLSSLLSAAHVDAEWPTSWLAELACGRSTDERRAEFQVRATKALKEAFALPTVTGTQDD